MVVKLLFAGELQGAAPGGFDLVDRVHAVDDMFIIFPQHFAEPADGTPTRINNP